MTNQISFGANFISPATILERNLKNTFEPKLVSFVELNPECASDVNAIRTVKDFWANKENFVSAVIEEIQDCVDYFDNAGKRFFAITQQKNSFENLEPSKLLGLTEIIGGKSNNIKIKFVQVHPKHQRKQKSVEFKHIGTAILDSLKNLFPTKRFSGQSTPEAVKFYLAQGFKLLDKDKNMSFLR